MNIRIPLHSFIRSRPHLSLATAIGVAAGLLLPSSWQQMTRLLTAWNVAVWFYLATMAWMMMRASHHKVKAMATRQDERAAMVLLALSVASVMSLATIGSQLSSIKGMAADERALHYALTIFTLVGSWFLVGTLFCFHYAHLYYRASEQRRPLKFPDDQQNPDYWDFLYFAFTIAVAVQTSDVSVQTRVMRKIVLGQSVLSFFFNLVVLGLSINIAAGLING
ncbi:DUF1345 domain-containing protein [Janthinobacterium sp. HLX7-2]|uniref:DUF1345 domain-containing protein n=1 Tax=Janthinobacterium sp. HLX7-2 TaxID=1259331 RepID=UPI003F213CC2